MYSEEQTTLNNWDNVEFEEIGEENDVKQWKPQPNDFIIGVYTQTTHGTGKGEGYVFHTLEDKEGNEVSILGCTVLNNKLDKIEYGTLIKIIFKGYATSQRGKEYKNYAVLVAKGN